MLLICKITVHHTASLHGIYWYCTTRHPYMVSSDAAPHSIFTWRLLILHHTASLYGIFWHCSTQHLYMASIDTAPHGIFICYLLTLLHTASLPGIFWYCSTQNLLILHHTASLLWHISWYSTMQRLFLALPSIFTSLHLRNLRLSIKLPHICSRSYIHP